MSVVGVIGCYDTKGDEYQYLIERLHHLGVKTIVINFGILGESTIPVDVTAAQIAEKGGSSLEVLRASSNRARSLEIMTRGLVNYLRESVPENSVDAWIGMGGGGSSAVISEVMRELPIGKPKLLLSTVASGDVGPYVGQKDVTMMYSVVDIAGLNRISKRLISNAAAAVCGMASSETKTESEQEKKLIAATMFGVTTPCVDRARAVLEQAGYEVVVFHATGSGGKSMEALIESGYFSGVLDVTTTEWCDELLGGVLSAGPNRLEAACSSGLPQVVSLGALDMANFWGIDSVPLKYQSRKLHVHNSNVTLMRTNAEECTKLGQIIARKLSRSTGPVRILIPLKGISQLDQSGQVFYDPIADAALFDAIRDNVSGNVVIREIDAHINDKEFAEELANSLLEIM